jgi:carbon storage regulator
VLVLSRRIGESVVLNPGTPDAITVTVVEVDRGKVRLAFAAPRDVSILRQELLNRGNPSDEFSDGIPKE